MHKGHFLLATNQRPFNGAITRKQIHIMTNTQIPHRYFAYDFDNEEVDLIEVDKQTFDSIEGEITTERHTMFSNGCNQICHTKENY